ncbi:MAG: flagellar biosynthesis anti-sigma factor FlgM [Spirochaetota bacterium]|jgi:negative regulator of flagellin synthesis FlgM|nr:flagellar biosynthesis anti-sigma factor FlgM [Spirochaetota bacterium]
MNIEGIGPIDQISKLTKGQKAQKTAKTESKDSISISSDAKTMGEVYKIAEQVKAADDVRWDRIAEVKEKLKDPNYINNAIVEDVADSLMKLFDIS